MSHTPGPWTACNGGECRCRIVMSEHHPVAQVTSGEWGDEWPDIRLCEREGVIGQRAEAYIERIVYGSVNEEFAAANARLIAAAPDLLEALEMYRNAETVLHESGVAAVPLFDLASQAAEAAIAKARGEEV